MITFETEWRTNRLVVWARVASGEVGPALPAGDLHMALSDRCGDPLLIESAEQASCGSAAALAFGPAQAADLLLMLGEEGISTDTLIWKRLATFIMDRIAAGQFYPTLDTPDAGPIAVWRVLVNRSDELDWLGGAAALVSTPEGIRPDQHIESFLHCLTDTLVRRTFQEDPFFATTAAKGKADGAPPDARFLSALLTENRSLCGIAPESLDQFRTWGDALQENPLRSTMRVLFRLRENEQQEGPAPWTVDILLQPAHGDETPVPAERLWELAADLPPILGRSLSAQRQYVLDQLSHAAEIWPMLKEQSSDHPGSVRLSAAEAVAFARQWALRLIDAGFSVELPKWARDPSAELALRLNVRPIEPSEWVFPEGELRHASGEGLSSPAREGQVGLNTLLQFDWRVAVGTMELSESQFESLLQSQSPLVKFNGEWIQVDADAARRAMEFVKANRGDMTLGDALRAAHATSRTETGLQIAGITGADWIGQLLLQDPGAQIQAIEQPGSFVGQLRPYQLRGLQWLAFLKRLGIGACLADDMGLGKTIQFIALLLHERETAAESRWRTPGPTLLFAPTSVLGNWAQEMRRFAPDLKLMVHHGIQRLHGESFRDSANGSDLVITSYALAHRDAEDFKQVRWHRLALDEAQKIKNPSAASTQSIRSIPAGFRVALTGTPIENHLSELWSIMEILNPGLLGPAATFREQFAVPIERMGDAARAGHLRDLIKPFVLRRTKADPAVAGDLPEKLEMKVFCNLTVEQASLYQRITDEMLGHIDAASGIRRRGLILAALTRLKQICDHPAMLDGKVAGYHARPNDLDARSGKCERLVEMLEEVLDEGDSALVFTQYKEMGDILEKLLPRRLNAPVLYLHGGTPAARRDALIRQFQDPKGGVRVFLLSLRAGGLGLNLTRANHVFHFDRWWNPAVEQQATDRAHRIGQTRKVQVHKYVCIGTMEERIDRMISDKMQLADRIITAGDEWLTNLSTEELRRTLQLSPDALEDDAGGAA